MFGMLKGLVGSKNLTREDMESVLDKMKDHLIGMTEKKQLNRNSYIAFGINNHLVVPQPRM